MSPSSSGLGTVRDRRRSVHSLCGLPSDLFLLGVSGLAGGNRHCSWFRVISEGCADPLGFFANTRAVLVLREHSRLALCRAPRQRSPLWCLVLGTGCSLSFWGWALPPPPALPGFPSLHRGPDGLRAVCWSNRAPLVCSWVSALTPLCYPRPVSQRPPFHDPVWGGGCLRSREFPLGQQSLRSSEGFWRLMVPLPGRAAPAL